MKNGVTALDLFKDVGSLGGPDEGFGSLVVMGDVVLNGGDEFRDAAENTPAYAVDR